MVHALFNNCFVELANQDSGIQDDPYQTSTPFNTPLDKENILLSMLEVYEKAQDLFTLNSQGNAEYLDIVNYVEVNLSMQNVLLIRSKLVIIKIKSLFIVLNLEMHEDKNVWNKIYNNTNWLNEMETLYSIMMKLKFEDI